MAISGTAMAIGSLIASAASAGATFMGTKAQGEAQAAQAETAAKQEELGAIQREADRKSDLAKAMASQIASAGTKGIQAFSGSPLSVLEADIESEKVATDRDKFNTQMGAMTSRLSGQIAEKQAGTSAGIGLLSDTISLAQKVPTTFKSSKEGD